ncbi:MAG: hypothetical protein HY976_01100 [Candidatus Kerfeldbacteria bacterium]|nr:hypothetical protein [Candidatus Kerfeldbacteria bacterium]
MGAKKKEVPFRGYYDPRSFNRKSLEHVRDLEVPVRAPHRSSMAPQRNIVPELVKMCRSAGVAVTADDFLKFKLRRPVLNGRIPTEYDVRRVRSGQLYIMYQALKHGMMHDLFVKILAAAGWHQRPETAVVHRPLPMKPRKGKVPDTAQLDLNLV